MPLNAASLLGGLSTTIGTSTNIIISDLSAQHGYGPISMFELSVIGVPIAVCGILFLVAWGYYFFTGKEGMGGGDIKLLAMIGAFTGWQGVCFTIFIASATGSLIGVSLILLAQKNLKFAVPFGPFLSIGAVAYLFFGPELIFWYYHVAFR